MRLSWLERSSHGVTPSSKNEEDSQLSLNKNALEAAKVAVYKEKRPTICFICLGNQSLPADVRTHAFYTLGDLSKHFKRKHL
ncbi:hypothetical protein BCR34DRAFT_491779 [Clohesyomyces aquaticus]|uniref:Uncharacterized protein n=1 Tax=Clohesyomyces aquaticus TaxID=1231657 RepID=A0A1Y1Z1M4_9PLEO|nr:hypothetical protein BCR34DRAFT_491779 [Clohesyomyces aquaticus]